MKKREKLIRRLCAKAECGVCKIEAHLTRTKGVKSIRSVRSLHPNVVICECVYEEDGKESTKYFVVPVSRLSIAHFYTGNTLVLTQLDRWHGIYTLDKITALMRSQFEGMHEMGPKAVVGISLLLEALGLVFKDEMQGELNFDETSPLDIT